MKFLLCLITGLISLCFGIRGFGQSNARTNQEEADDMFSNLDLSYATSGIIYSRVFPAAALNAFPITEVSNAGHWREAQSEFYRGALNPYGMLPPAYLEDLIFESYNMDNKIPLGVILGHFNEVNSDAVETDAQGKLRLRAGFNSSQVFTSKQIDAVSFMLTSIPLGTNNFHLPKWAVCSNQGVGVVSVSINFGDGNPVRVLSPGSSAVQATYTTPGTKQVTYTVNCTDGSQRTAKSSFEVSPNARVVNNYPYRGPGGDNIDSVRIEADIAFQGYSETAASKGKGDALIYYAFGRDQIRKPVIILDGFDPQGTRGAKDLYEEYLSYSDNGMKIFGTDLRENTPGNGYDVLILNPPKYQYGSPKTVRVCRRVGQGQQDCEDIQVMNIRSGGGDYIERNAMVLVKLIQMLKQQLQANGSSEKIVVMGPSMGGLISRYALRYMEMNGMDHNCKLWVSFDSPHHGANISMGLQDFLFHTGYEMEMAGPKKIVDETLDSPAAKQMLIHHFRGRSNDLPHGAPGYRDRFVQAINQMGFPQSSCLRKVAINNGSKNATSQNFSGGAEALSLSMKLTNLGHITCAVMGGLLCIVARDRIAEFKIYASPNGNDHSLTMRKRFTSFNWGGVDRFVYGVGQPSLDNLPGSYRPYFQQVADDAVAKKWVYQTTVNVHFARPTFIPAFSSWALSNYQNRNWGASLANIRIKQETPFDAVYAPDANEGHTELTKAGVDFVKAQMALADQGCNTGSLPLPNGCYTIKAKHSNKLLQPENDNNGARIRQYGANGQSNQVFRLESVDNNQLYKVIYPNSGRVWELQDGNYSDGTPIRIANWSNLSYQKWRLNAYGDGSIIMDVSNKFGSGVADIEGVSTNDGAGLFSWAEHGGDNQHFFFTPVSCPTPPSCNFNISVTPSSVTTTPNGSVTLNASCSGDCSGVTYSWSGNGISGTGTQKTFNAPGSENSYTYTLTASKNGCGNKTANATVIVQNSPSPINLTLSIWRAGVLGVRTKIQDINNGDNIPISALNGGEANWFIDIAGGQISSSPGTGNYNHVSLYLNGNGYSNQGWGPENVINAGLPPYGLHGRDWGSYPPVGNNYQLTGKVFFNSTELASKTVTFNIVSCTPPSAPSISITQGSTACSSTPNNSVTLTATGCGGTVTWYRNGTQVASGSAMHNTNIPGAYTATCTSGGCASGFSGTVNVAQTSGCGSSPGNCYTLSFKGENPKYVSNHNGILKVKQSDNSDSQIWKMEDAGSGYFKLVSQGSTNGTGIGKVLGVRNQGSSDEDIIDLQTSASGDHQLWSRTFLTGDDANRYKIERKGTAYRISSYRMWGQGNLSDGESDLAIYSDPGDVFGWNKWTFTQKTCPGSGSRLGLQAEGVFENENTLYNLTVAPNPSDGSFEASFYLSDELPARLVVSDMLGRTWHDHGILGKGSHRESIRLPREASGIFVVILRSATGTQTRKIVVAR